MSAQAPETYPPIGWFGPVRFAIRFSMMVGLLLLCVPLHYLWRLFGYISPWPPRFLAGIAWICNVRVTKEGVRLKENVFYVSNHLSWLDIPIVGGYTHAAFVAQDGIAKWPVIGWLASLNHTIFVSRGDRLGVSAQIEQLKEALHDHQPVTIFPEGTTTDGTSLLPFKPALFAVLTPPPRPMMVQPVLLDFYGRGAEFAWVGEEGAPHNAWRVLCRRDMIPVRIVFLDPFDPVQCNDRKEIAATAREQIRRALSASLGGKPVL
ncbi:1-acyl-sn-glycerol-3-phosphate acyltransferase [Parasphingopyxis marina]|uniref:1-acyl-sn-glycerol-3-phosphate acyltransferase n=1 Tax=Parasphingopyxis marina TaxID=2761622 RepID=A0A842I221_9SPHN|nr:1-acyl-sn-glycerol-3-phosphate acyltransferase [Parasphingopyxis marina]MBC2778841.1 1-acyl-sn-glycerol-3-phosphate acyltransferase [Parasphingopyxis marina]